MNNVMLDLETLGKRSNAVITSIGAVYFDHTGLGQTFYAVVDPQSCVDIGMTMDVDTVMWWMRQSDEARAAFSAKGVVPIQVALFDFAAYLGSKDREVWGNGATFDNVILANAYRAAQMKAPWAFWNDRCHRTLKNLHPQIVAPKLGVAHNALDDAISQAHHASHILAHMRNMAVAMYEPIAIPQGGTA